MKFIPESLLAFIFVISSVEGAIATSWPIAIERVGRLADKYYEAAKERTGWISGGTALNNADIRMHRCAIVGRMLGLKGRVSVFEPPYPTISSASDDELWWSAVSLQNWITTANQMRATLPDAKRAIWNLECAIEPGLQDTYFIDKNRDDKSSIYKISDDGETLYVIGDIENGFFEKFRNAVEENKELNQIALGSAGGSVLDALRAGMLIRERGFETTIYANCYSACPLVFMGGVARTVWDSQAELGFHQISLADGSAVPLSDELYVELAKYMSSMGVEYKEVIFWMWEASPDEMKVFRGDHELCDTHVATFVYHGCVSR
ncbi:hypothetical protein P2H44_07575 [Albimonas sp. CAU 1670]|uniref:COG3904 family protein n=1 Tax=Albimonas sp. CAU 1670 TaxID=3032599 RepID=UPI0023DCDC68|nr:hypothetical protein [Albimonas sp. CAU 1670]MDF2232412.1 hypothetical protein [Albimonas sp. CAU 1670]